MFRYSIYTALPYVSIDENMHKAPTHANDRETVQNPTIFFAFGNGRVWTARKNECGGVWEFSYMKGRSKYDKNRVRKNHTQGYTDWNKVLRSYTDNKSYSRIDNYCLWRVTKKRIY